MSDNRWGWSNDPEGLGPQDPYRPPPQGPPQDPSWFGPEPGPTSAWSATLDELAMQGQRARSQARTKRRMVIAGAVALVVLLAAGVTVLVVFVTGSGDDSTAGTAPAGWCATGTDGAVTTVSRGGDPTTPTGVVAAFVGAAIDDRSAVGARATLSEAAAIPTVAQLQQWISALPASTNAWCAQITTTESTARLLVTLRVRTDAGIAQVGVQDTFYVSEIDPNRWAIDAIVTGDGS
ncbi:hypothetical protein [Williamsia phyllosphaerae]|uniref:DUF8176 domain-containing protein n=1 Tax=Williamsia phyllosphaerae TaxID=885042 RepID=A0ABQ1UE62_9NOCA|nr:hypothetical protein [Williamsia phyllosphaerae]GGF16999.1 hypothetical protein GCM10007298_11260 [Williamsia phyllosphaerae]